MLHKYTLIDLVIIGYAVFVVEQWFIAWPLILIEAYRIFRDTFPVDVVVQEGEPFPTGPFALLDRWKYTVLDVAILIYVFLLFTPRSVGIAFGLVLLLRIWVDVTPPYAYEYYDFRPKRR